MAYTVKSHRNGKQTVAYECAMCKAPLESPLEDAGSVFPCPTCGEKLKTPGSKELAARKEAERLRRQAKDDATRKLAESSLSQLEQAATATATASPISYATPSPKKPKVSKPMSGSRLFLIISGAVACGITLAIVAYFVFFAAVATINNSGRNSANKNTNTNIYTAPGHAISKDSDDFINEVMVDDIDSLRTKLLGTVNWSEVATPALKALTSTDKLESSTYETEPFKSDDEQKKQFWRTLADRLVKNGADVNAAIPEVKQPGSLQYLLSHGSNINALDESGKSGLENCVDTGSNYADLYESGTAAFLANGANPNLADSDGNTPLHQAAKSNSVKEIARLISARASINAKNKAGQTPLAIAILTVQANAAEALKASGGTE